MNSKQAFEHEVWHFFCVQQAMSWLICMIHNPLKTCKASAPKGHYAMYAQMVMPRASSFAVVAVCTGNKLVGTSSSSIAAYQLLHSLLSAHCTS
jgi:hypothetical protein